MKDELYYQSHAGERLAARNHAVRRDNSSLRRQLKAAA